MSAAGHVVRCVSAACSNRGYQARVPLKHDPKRYVSTYCSAKVYGGMRAARLAAEEALPALRRKAKRRAA